MDLKQSLPKSWRHSRWLWALLAAIAVIIIIVIVVPLAVLLPRKHHKTKVATVIVPLYIYPTNDSSWEPLYEAVQQHPYLNFTVIVNPSSGPGNGSTPDSQYVTAVTKLNSYDNVQTVGYVRTGYASRNISDVVDEVNTYAGWYDNSTSLAMHGIFFDEAPHEYTASAVSFMITADEAAKSATGLQGDRTVIHNPGTVPDSEFNVTREDITVIFENTYDEWSQLEASVASLQENRSAYSIMVNSVPTTLDNTTMSDFLTTLSGYAEYLFLTDNVENYYESFGDGWLDFVDQMPEKKH